MLKKLSILLVIGMTAFLIVGLLKHERVSENINPCLLCGSKRISIIYMSGKRSIKKTGSKGCSLCDADNHAQWNTLYKMYGGRDHIEFIVIFPEKLSNYKELDMPYDLSIMLDVKAAAKQDIIILCKRGEKIYENIGTVDMAFVRKVNETLVTAHFD
jgi:hypothetical protein